MADFSVNGRTKVKTLKKYFKDEYGLMLDVKQGKSNRSADSDASIAQVRAEKKEGDIKVHAKTKIGNLEKKFFSECGVKVNIKYANGKSIDNDLTLGSVKKDKK